MINKFQNISIDSIATYLPKGKISLKDLAEDFGEDSVANIIKVTGIENIRISDPSETSSDMCMRAAEELIMKAEVDKNEIGAIVFVSQTPDYVLPATSNVIQNKLDLPNETLCFDINAGCSGYIYGILQACILIETRSAKKVLVLAGDTSTKLIHPMDRSLKLVFGDAGSATLISRGDKDLYISMQTDGKGFDKLIVPHGGFRNPITPESYATTVDKDGNCRSSINLFMDGMSILEFAMNRVPKNIFSILEYSNKSIKDVDLFALHQANRFIINAIRKKMNIEDKLMPSNTRDFGNTGSASIPLLLSDILGIKKTGNLSSVVLSGFGVGLSWGSALCDISNTLIFEPINR